MKKLAFISALLISTAPVQAQSVGGADALRANTDETSTPRKFTLEGDVITHPLATVSNL